MNKELIKIILQSLVIALIITFIKTIVFDSPKTQPTPKISEPKAIEQPSQKSEHLAETNKIINIKIKPMKELSGMQANEVLEIRRNSVKNSTLFANIKNYTPNTDVFRLQDNLQWISAPEINCHGANNNPDIGKGISRESLDIMNPEMMFVPIIGTYSSESSQCSEIDYLIPYKMTYNPDTRTIKAYINHADFYKKNQYGANIILKDINARDFGYTYAHADRFNKIQFKHENNLSNEIIRTNGFLHRGYACGLPEGCNNYSPYESGYDFHIKGAPAMINIKLWYDKPVTTSQKADLNYQMLFN